MSLEKGIVPENWKLALVDPRLKKLGMDLVFENFRPVNNLHFLAKVAEKVVMSQLVNHCNENAPLPVSQSAYRHSTETALLKVQNDILINMDNEEVTLLVMVNMSAAFDTIDHNILIDILKNNFGVVDSALLGPVVQKPINANLGLNLLNLGINFNPRLLCVVQS